MRIWIDKEKECMPQDEWADAYVFSLNKKGYSSIFSNIKDIWYRMDNLQIDSKLEDLFVIGLSIFACDKRILRRHHKDGWTREIYVSIPVLENWDNTVNKWEQMLSFLTGDIWHIEFRNTEAIYSKRINPNRKHLNISSCDSVCLFSGGLDSFCGAIKLLEEGHVPCLIGHNEYPKLKKKQNDFVEIFRDVYDKPEVRFLSFTANARSPVSLTEGKLKQTENTSRGRSLLFLCAALTIAGLLGPNTPVYIPENGFIGLNIPLTQSRRGTCSTRTTHPHFLRQFKEILQIVGVENPIINFFAYNTKREIVNLVKDTEAFKKGYSETISCSHPCLARYYKDGNREYPINCGYCYPCLIRKSSLLDIEDEGRYSYEGEQYSFLVANEENDKGSDLRAILSSVYRYNTLTEREIRRYISSVGCLSNEEIDGFVRVYKSSMDDLIELFSRDKKMRDYIGI